jgi:hypothetical protein
VSALLRREYLLNPDNLTDEEWLKLYAEWKFSEEQRHEMRVAAHKQALADVLSQLFPTT